MKRLRWELRRLMSFRELVFRPWSYDWWLAIRYHYRIRPSWKSMQRVRQAAAEGRIPVRKASEFNK